MAHTREFSPMTQLSVPIFCSHIPLFATFLFVFHLCLILCGCVSFFLVYGAGHSEANFDHPAKLFALSLPTAW